MTAIPPVRHHTPTLTAADALAVAQPDALAAYRDLTPFQVRVRLEPDGWHVDYEHADDRIQGGGPHYVIDQRTGIILRKKYEQ